MYWLPSESLLWCAFLPKFCFHDLTGEKHFHNTIMAYLPGLKKYVNSAFIEHLIVEDCLECVTLVFTISLIIGPNNDFSVVMELSKFVPGKRLTIYLGLVVRKAVNVNPGLNVN